MARILVGQWLETVVAEYTSDLTHSELWLLPRLQRGDCSVDGFAHLVMSEFLATCCCAELLLKLLQQLGVAPLFASPIQP